MSARSNVAWSGRRERRELADRLAVEYAGAVTPGQVEAAVTASDTFLESIAPGEPTERMAMCESMARHRLVERIALAHG